jgi:hypothetical protein
MNICKTIKKRLLLKNDDARTHCFPPLLVTLPHNNAAKSHSANWNAADICHLFTHLAIFGCVIKRQIIQPDLIQTQVIENVINLKVIWLSRLAEIGNPSLSCGNYRQEELRVISCKALVLSSTLRSTYSLRPIKNRSDHLITKVIRSISKIAFFVRFFFKS